LAAPEVEDLPRDASGDWLFEDSRAEGVPNEAALFLARDQPGMLEDGDMVRNINRRDVQHFRNFGDGSRAVS
jgi:hypothetical protein